jgi:hypothetical protein
MRSQEAWKYLVIFDDVLRLTTVDSVRPQARTWPQNADRGLPYLFYIAITSSRQDLDAEVQHGSTQQNHSPALLSSQPDQLLRRQSPTPNDRPHTFPQITQCLY